MLLSTWLSAAKCTTLWISFSAKILDGSNYIHYMFKKYDGDIRIINLDALTYAGNLENLKDIEDRPNYTFVKADICDKEAVSRIFAENEIHRVSSLLPPCPLQRAFANFY